MFSFLQRPLKNLPLASNNCLCLCLSFVVYLFSPGGQVRRAAPTPGGSRPPPPPPSRDAPPPPPLPPR